MQTLTERFWHPLAITRTVLRGILGVYVCYTTTGACCLVGRDAYKLAPGHVGNRLRQTVILHQVGNLERFKRQHPMGVDQASSGLMTKVIAPVGNPFMDMRYDLAALGTLRGALRRFGQPPLGLRKRLFIRTEEMRIGNVFARAQRGKAAHPHINTYSTCRSWLWTCDNAGRSRFHCVSIALVS